MISNYLAVKRAAYITRIAVTRIQRFQNHKAVGCKLFATELMMTLSLHLRNP